MNVYEFESSVCDVKNKDKLVTFRAKRAEWLSLFDRDPIHPISHQISAMLWNDAAYRSFNEARRFATSDRPLAAIAPMLAELIDIGYVATQILAIGKLLEKNPAHPTKAVVSLRRVLDEISTNQDLFTREIYVSFDGLPYDYQTVRDRHIQEVTKSGDTGARWLPTKGPEAWGMSEIMHRSFDRLSGVSSNERSRGDRIKCEVFTKLQAALEMPLFENLLLQRHKLIAHAADESNRPNVFDEVTLDKLAEAHRILVQVSFVVSANILCGSGVGGVPTPQFDPFEHLENPFVLKDQLAELAEYWHQHGNERENWLSDAQHDILGS